MREDSNHYDTLNLSPTATIAEIKQAYRRLVKMFHPDTQNEVADRETIIRINAAYEVLGDPHQRHSYDQYLSNQRSRDKPGNRQYRTSDAASKSYRQQRHTAQNTDEQLQRWLKQVYSPVNRLLCRILNRLGEQLDELSADPFDDQLMEAFCAYLNDCRQYLNQAQMAFRSQPNPPSVAGAAIHLYYCLNQVADGIEELELFTLNYDERYLHTGQELFRIAVGLRSEAQQAVNVAV